MAKFEFGLDLSLELDLDLDLDLDLYEFGKIRWQLQQARLNYGSVTSRKILFGFGTTAFRFGFGFFLGQK